jgi:uncharacterized protein
MKIIQRSHWLLGGGLGLVTVLWLMNGLTHTLMQVGEVALMGGGVLLGVAWLSQGASRPPQPSAAIPLDRPQVAAALGQVQTLLEDLRQEIAITPSSPDGTDWGAIVSAAHYQKQQLTLDLDRQELRLAIVGDPGVGKTTLMNLLMAQWGDPALPTPLAPLSATPEPQTQNPGIPLNCWEVPSSQWAEGSLSQVDGVLWVTTGDLTETHFQQLQRHGAEPQAAPLWVALNKLDQYLPGQQATLLSQLCQRLQGQVPSDRIIPVAAAPAPIQVRRQQPDGSWQVTQEPGDPAVSSLLETLAPWFTDDRAATLRWRTTYRQSQHLRQSLQECLNQVRRQRALPVIERYQWLAGGAAFVNPVPSLDLLAAAALNGQMILELSRLYHKPLSLDQAQELAATLAEVLVKLGLVELSTQALTAALKTQGYSFWLGAGLQGISAAYLTRMAGLSLVDYFQTLEPTAEVTPGAIVERLQPLLQSVLTGDQQRQALQGFVQGAVAHLKGLQPQSAAP